MSKPPCCRARSRSTANCETLMSEIGQQLLECGQFWKDPQYQRSSHVRALRLAVRQWAHETKRLKKVDVELSTAVQACARLEQMLSPQCDPELFQINQEQVGSLLAAAEAILAMEELRTFMAERNKAALDASALLFGSKGVIKHPECGVIPTRRNEGKPVVKAMSDGWQPRWPGDCGDPFEPYQQLIEQFLHSAVSYHARALEQVSTAFAAVRKASKAARDVAYVRTLAASAGVSVKEYQRLLEMFNKIDCENSGTISKPQLMDAMKRDKDIAAFMQLSRAKGKDGRRESFEGVFNRIDVEGMGAVTWEAFLRFFSSERSLAGDGAIQPPIMCLQPAVCKAKITLCKAGQGCGPAVKPDTLVSKLVHPCGMATPNGPYSEIARALLWAISLPPQTESVESSSSTVHHIGNGQQRRTNDPIRNGLLDN